MREYIVFFDFLRCYAVLSVVLFHFPIIADIASLKYVYECLPGVPLFFALSGYLITTILVDKKEKTDIGSILRNFYARRILRIFPIYYLTIVLLLLFKYQVYQSQFVYDFFYLSNFKIAFDGGYHNTIAPHFWSLAVEEQFYLLWAPAVLLSKNKTVLWASAAMLMGGILCLVIFGHHSPYYLFFMDRTFGNLSYLGLGCLLALMVSRHFLQLYNHHFYAILILLVSVFVLGFVYCKDNAYFQYFYRFFIISFLLLFSLKINTRELGSSLLLRPFLFVGKISYGVYIYHMFVPEALHTLGIRLPTIGGIQYFNVLVLVITLIVSTLSWYTIEKYFLNLKTRFSY